jgi:hypothetical protein
MSSKRFLTGGIVQTDYIIGTYDMYTFKMTFTRKLYFILFGEGPKGLNAYHMYVLRT